VPSLPSTRSAPPGLRSPAYRAPQPIGSA
jgi:hypothetical protein